MCTLFGILTLFCILRSSLFFNNNNSNNNGLDKVRKVRVFRLLVYHLFYSESYILPIPRQKIRFEILLYSYTPKDSVHNYVIVSKNSYIIHPQNSVSDQFQVPPTQVRSNLKHFC